MLSLSRGQRPAEAESSEIAKCGGEPRFLTLFLRLSSQAKGTEEAWRLAQNMVK